jgi:hypothetical protein
MGRDYALFYRFRIIVLEADGLTVPITLAQVDKKVVFCFIEEYQLLEVGIFLI